MNQTTYCDGRRSLVIQLREIQKCPPLSRIPVRKPLRFRSVRRSGYSELDNLFVSPPVSFQLIFLAKNKIFLLFFFFARAEEIFAVAAQSIPFFINSNFFFEKHLTVILVSFSN